MPESASEGRRFVPRGSGCAPRLKRSLLWSWRRRRSRPATITTISAPSTRRSCSSTRGGRGRTAVRWMDACWRAAATTPPGASAPTCCWDAWRYGWRCAGAWTGTHAACSAAGRFWSGTRAVTRAIHPAPITPTSGPGAARQPINRWTRPTSSCAWRAAMTSWPRDWMPAAAAWWKQISWLRRSPTSASNGSTGCTTSSAGTSRRWWPPPPSPATPPPAMRRYTVSSASNTRSLPAFVATACGGKVRPATTTTPWRRC